MEIHQPEHRISTLKDFIIHILIVTVGILIALGLEQTVEALHHRHLAHVARENFRAEVRQNRDKLSLVLANNEKVHAFVITLLNRSDKNRTSANSSAPDSVSPAFTTLRSSSWETAVGTQSLLYLSFDEANKLADIYHAQRQFDELESRDQQLWFEMSGFIADLSSLEGSERAVAKRDLGTALAYSESIDALGRRLLKQYEESGSEN